MTALVGSLLPQIIGIESEDIPLNWKLANLGIGLMHLANLSSIIYTAYKNKMKPKFRGFKKIFDALFGPTLIVLHFAAAFGYNP